MLLPLVDAERNKSQLIVRIGLFWHYVDDLLIFQREYAMDSRRSLSILYGSETGTAESVAVRLYRESKRYHFNSRVCPMDAYPAAEIVQEELVVFVCSTTGQGDEPENMRRFWKLLLRKRLTADTLAGMRFGVIGLGDSSYPKSGVKEQVTCEWILFDS